jgi:hypothetical protein
MADFQAWDQTSHPIVRLEDDWNQLLDHGLTKPCAYIVRVNGSYYEALSGVAGTVAYGGADNAGSTDGTSANAVLQAAITNAGGGQVNIKKGTYPNLALDIVIPSYVFAELGTTFQSAATDYAITVGDGNTRIADNSWIHGILFEPYDDTAYGGIHINGPVVDLVVDRCHFKHFEDASEYAIKQENSWETLLNRCRFWDTQHALLLDGTGYVYGNRCYFSANDYGTKGTTYNYGVYAKSGSLYATYCQFETNNTTGVAFRNDIPGNNRFYACDWESGSNLRSIWRNTDVKNYPDMVFGQRPDDPIVGADNYPGLKIADAKTQLNIDNHNTTDDDDGGTATITHFSGGCVLTTQNVKGQHAMMTWYWTAAASGSDPVGNIYRRNPEFDIYIYLSSIADEQVWVTWGRDGSTAANRHWGFYITDADLYLTAGDNAAGSTTDTTENLSATTWHHLNVEFKYGGSPVIRMMLDGDSVTTEHSTNLPEWESYGNYLFCVKIQTGAAAAKTVNYTTPVLRFA